uniref:Uncharacterized protein n=1 Tax=Picea sitchensis TaxID=3332 RepID=A9NTS1_PICSI|nr:unknown [Picea sitchensis]
MVGSMWYVSALYVLRQGLCFLYVNNCSNPASGFMEDICEDLTGKVKIRGAKCFFFSRKQGHLSEIHIKYDVTN